MKSEYKEFFYYVRKRLNEWLQRKLGNDRYQTVIIKLNLIGCLAQQIFYENLYLAIKHDELGTIAKLKKYPRLKLAVAVVVLMLATRWLKWLVVVDLALVISYLYYRHYECRRDVSYHAVQLLSDQLSNLNPKNRYYNYPLREFRSLFKLYRLLHANDQHIDFDDFILVNDLEVIDESGFKAILKIGITSGYPMVMVRNLNDYLLKEFRILLNTNANQYIYKGTLKQDTLAIMEEQPLEQTTNNMKYGFNYQAYPEIQNELLQESQQQALEEQQEYVETHHLPDKIWQIWEYFDKYGEDLGFSYWDNNGNSVTGNDGYISMRMRLIGETTYNDAKKKISLVEKQLRCDVMTRPVASDHGSFQMTFVLGQITAPKTTNVDIIRADAAVGKLALGNSRTGEYKVKLPRGDDLTSIMCGALSRSGKSTMMTQVILSLLYLRTSAGYDYQDVFIATVKDEDYIVNGFKQSGMLVKSDPAEIYNMLQYVDDQATKRKALFIERGVKNIKEFNHQFPSEYLGKMLIVFDEYANTLAVAESERIEVGGKKVKLRDAIERIMVKIGQEHGSRGVSIIVITQQFAKGEVGRLFDVTNIQILGYARSNVWNSIDNTQEMSKYLESKSEQRRGLFFVNAPDLPTDKPQIAFNSGFTEVHTANIDTQEVRRDFDRKFETAKNYGEPVESVQDKSIRTDLEAPVDFGNLIKTSNNND
ncbi:hypothetical protein [Lactiplantibacillus plantarum]|uniref:hypothetical protein n=1 Tax=Lactiplantibacillus plantarum TaxID=1590 RepID=UPI00385304B3|nr:hypothetical protein [Lactiplantibacillus plantarum]MCG0836979.1 hypothetical protein [Lactiplantibacillus plantarum]